MFVDSSGNETLAGTEALQMIFDVNTEDFESRVMTASMQMPIVVDFWSPQCGPCKQMMPVLEQVIMAAGGQVLLAKVNVEENHELAVALRVQSVPTVFGFFQGRPVDAFTGAQSESKIREFVQKLITVANSAQPGALDIAEAIEDAAALLAEGKAKEAHELYSAILHQDALNADAYVGLVRCFIAIDHIDRAQTLVDQAPEEISKTTVFEQAKTALELAQNVNKMASSVEELEAKIKADQNDHQARIDLAYVLYAQGKKKEATETLLDSIAIDREWNDSAARTELFTLFAAMGNSDPITLSARRKLSSLLFS